MSRSRAFEQLALRFSKGYRLHFDNVRQQWFIQAPERAYEANPIAVAILRKLDGTRSNEEIIDQLSHEFNAPRTRIKDDTLALLALLLDKKILRRC